MAPHGARSERQARKPRSYQQGAQTESDPAGSGLRFAQQRRALRLPAPNELAAVGAVGRAPLVEDAEHGGRHASAPCWHVAVPAGVAPEARAEIPLPIRDNIAELTGALEDQLATPPLTRFAMTAHKTAARSAPVPEPRLPDLEIDEGARWPDAAPAVWRHVSQRSLGNN